MTIQFTDLLIKTAPAGNQGLTVSLVENNPAIVNPTEQQSATINTANLNPGERATVDAFIALLKSKL